MEKYTYLFLSLFLLAIWSIVFWLLKNNSRKILMKISVMGGLAGLISELWYFKDYWHPPSLLGNAKISLEDFLFSFAFVGIAATIYKVIFKKDNEKHKKGYKTMFLTFFAVGILSMLLLSSILKINSIYVSSFAFITFSLTMVAIRKDLVWQSIMSGLLSLLVIIPIYILLFNFMFPNYWDKYWLLVNTTFGIKIIGNIPLTELLWYFSLGCFTGIAYDFYSGREWVLLKDQ